MLDWMSKELRITVYGTSDTKQKLLGIRDIHLDFNEIFIDRDSIVRIFEDNDCSIDISMTNEEDYPFCYVNIYLNNYENSIYGGLYKLNSNLFMNEISDTIIKNIQGIV